MTAKTRQFGDTHLLQAAKGPDGKIISAHTGLLVGGSGIIYTNITVSLAEMDFD